MRSILAGAAVLAGGALLVAGCSSGGSSSSAAAGGTSSAGGAAPVTVRLGYLANITHAPALIGVKNGYFAKELGSAGIVEDDRLHQRHPGDHRDPRRPDRRRLRGPEPGHQRLAEVQRHRDQGHLRRRHRRRVRRGQARHHLRGAAQGTVAGHPVARQHPGRGGALLAEAAGPCHRAPPAAATWPSSRPRRTPLPCSSSSPGRSPAAPSRRLTTSRWSRPAARCC